MSTSDEQNPRGFLTRWSQRKLAQEKPREQEIAPDAPDVAAIGEPESAVAEAEPEPFDVSLLPSIEDLTGESSVSMFMQAGVPEALRNAALRKVWSADPFIRDDTGPVDYGWNFNDPTSMPGFGPMGENTDMAMLLRQAIGEVEPVTEAPIDIAAELTSDPVPAASHDLAEAPAPVDPIEETPGLSGDDWIAPTSSKSADASQPDERDKESPIPPGASRRPRHGGALPS